MQSKRVSFLILFALLVSLPIPTFAEDTASILILDWQGRTQSLVETQEESLGTVKVFIHDDLGEPVEDVEVSLVEDKQNRTFNTTQSRSMGIASFFDVPPAAYRVRLDCAEFDLEQIQISGEALIDTASHQERNLAVDKLNIIDASGRTRAFAELSVSSQANISLRVKSPSQKELDGLTVRLVEMKGQEELEVIQSHSANPDGSLEFTGISGGLYKIEIADCSSMYTLGGVSILDFPVSGIVCPPGALAMKALESQKATAFGASSETSDDQSAAISILDQEGKTQSLVQTEPGSQGTIKVFIQDLEGTPVEGAQVSLINAESEQLVGTATSRARGVASFFDISPGSYKIEFECSALDITSVKIAVGSTDRSSSSSSHSPAMDKINIVDIDGHTRAFEEVPLGSSAQIKVTLSSKEENSLKQLKVRLVELRQDKELEIIAEATTDETGTVSFPHVVGGEYKVEFSGCSDRFSLGGVGLFDYPASAVICAPAALALGATGSSGATAAASAGLAQTFGVATAGTSAASTGLGITAGGLAAGAAAGGAVGGGIVIAVDSTDSGGSGTIVPPPSPPGGGDLPLPPPGDTLPPSPPEVPAPAPETPSQPELPVPPPPDPPRPISSS